MWRRWRTAPVCTPHRRWHQLPPLTLPRHGDPLQWTCRHPRPPLAVSVTPGKTGTLARQVEWGLLSRRERLSRQASETARLGGQRERASGGRRRGDGEERSNCGQPQWCACTAARVHTLDILVERPSPREGDIREGHFWPGRPRVCNHFRQLEPISGLEPTSIHCAGALHSPCTTRLSAFTRPAQRLAALKGDVHGTRWYWVRTALLPRKGALNSPEGGQAQCLKV